MITLFTSYYKDKNEPRNREYLECLFRNVENELIDKIVLLCEHSCPHTHDKLEKISFEGRPTYTDFFNLMGDGINILANSDIYFDESLELVKGLQPNECYALSRWDVDHSGKAKMYNMPCSQDTWIFNGKPNIKVNFGLGKPGCDNRIAWEIQNAGYKLSNPATRVKTYHQHLSNVRNYNRTTDTIPEPHLQIPIT